jgi:alkanesulfonate monooxygenase SsuD/methylene tetrahydromethanopterin reductase-like flavin-dependent oxidoreductase (luciferase family)
MPDYGHPLLFGTFITPVNTPAQAPVQFAQLSEQLGYDLATFQDHPYQAAFADTWTLISYAAAKTERIHLSGNVLNLPLRQPAVLARSAASLDLLSGGRIDLGLGAGGFWDAIEAMGGRRLTPGQAVDALEEAIAIMRGVWSAGERTPLRLPGEYYSVNGAKRGPAPAHEIPIWLGAYKPRMLRLTGRAADGWLPSLAYLQPGDLAKGNAIIDEAAEEAGRSPREIRRLLNIGELPAQQLIDMALQDGIGTFILTGDDPRALQRFAEEVIPAVREAVDAERTTRGTDRSKPRGPLALAQRRTGIDYDAVPASLQSRAVEPGDAEYFAVRANYMRGGAPGLVLRPENVEQVAEAVRFAAAQPEIPLGVRSGGHGISGRSTNDGGIVIDLGALNAIEVLDESRRLVRIGPGARWGDVAAALVEFGWGITSGDYGGVGVGGIGTAGGIGFLAREHGLTIDHLRAAEVVLADGSIVRASADENPELFWGVRGAGGQLGVVTSLEFEADEVGDVGWVQLGFQIDDPAEFLLAYGDWSENSPRDTTMFLILSGRTARLYGVVDSDDPDTIVSRVQPLAEVAPLAEQSLQLASYAAVMGNTQPGPHRGQGEPVSRSGMLEHITPEFAQAAARLIESGVIHWFQLRPVGGAVGDVDPDATAFPSRRANFSVVVMGADAAAVDAGFDQLRPFFDGLYVSFDSGLQPERVEDAWPPKALARLRALKAELDPTNRFRDNFSVSGLAPIAP